ncbi:MAG: hypothetical protein ACKOB4_16860 [Acidobacteriota bacterium]
MNYYSYFSEIEDEFVRRRGSHLLVSTLDWSLMETWRQRAIPLHIVLRGINQAFDSYDKRENRGRKVNTLFFCRQAVEECHFSYLESRIGAEDEASAQPPATAEVETGDQTFTPATIIGYLSAQIEELERLARRATPETSVGQVLQQAVSRLSEVRSDIELSRVISCENIEADLTLIEQTILGGLREATPPETLTAWEKEGKKQLKAYRETMKPEIYRQTLDNFLARELRRQFQIPRLSLFYLSP